MAIYLLSNGMYSKAKHLINRMLGDTARENRLARQQEAVRKAVEILFALYQLSRLLDKGYMEDAILACCIMHNMIGEVQKESYDGMRNARVTDLKHFYWSGFGRDSQGRWDVARFERHYECGMNVKVLLSTK
jgi:hypothetical protein